MSTEQNKQLTHPFFEGVGTLGNPAASDGLGNDLRVRQDPGEGQPAKDPLSGAERSVVGQ